MRITPFALLSAALVATGATAQDSVAKTTAAMIDSDAVDAFSAGEQLNTYVVDLAPITTSWGTAFGIAPIAKGSVLDPNFATGFINSQAASARALTGVATPFASYQVWSNAGQGVNNNININDPGTPVVGPAQTTQVAFGFAESSTGSENIVSAIVNYEASNPSRLYVARIPAATNGTLLASTSSNFGFGAIDADGNVSARADDFGLTGGNQVSGNNTFRVSTLARNTAVMNVIQNTDGTDAPSTQFLVINNATAHNVCGQIPEDVAGRPVYIGSNFNSEYVYENVPNSTTTTTAHKGAVADHRGATHFSPAVIFPGSVGTVTLLGNDGSQTRSVLLFGVDANGNVMGTQNLVPPANITDITDGSSWPASGTVDEFNSHLSQTAFEGGTGQAALGLDQSGDAIVATMIQGSVGAGPVNPIGAIITARFDPSSPGSVTWTTVAYNNGTTGKAIIDGAGGNVIGRCVGLDQVTGGTPPGPSFSVPVVDAVGNCWFLAAVELFGGGGSDFDTALLRGVYDASTGGYNLELVLQLGQIISGQNSGIDYQIRFMAISEGATGNSISSGTMFSGNGVQTAFNNMSTAGLETCDPRTTGGVVLAAGIVYDVNADGNFEDPSQVVTVDQEYNALLYIGHNGDTTSNCTVGGSGPQSYCTAKASSSGCLAAMTTSDPSNPPVSGAGGYSAVLTNAQGNRPGIFFTSNTSPAAIVFQGGTLCFNPPLKRSVVLFTAGTNNMCDGGYSRVINDGSLIPPPLPGGFDAGPGNTSYIQAWHRDPALMDGFDTALSNAIEIDWL